MYLHKRTSSQKKNNVYRRLYRHLNQMMVIIKQAKKREYKKIIDVNRSRVTDNSVECDQCGVTWLKGQSSHRSITWVIYVDRVLLSQNKTTTPLSQKHNPIHILPAISLYGDN